MIGSWLAFACGFAVAILFASVSDSAEAATRSEVKRIVVEESLRAGFPPSLAMAVAQTESDFRDDAQSAQGARGVMQVMPKTAKEIYGVNADQLWDPRLNVQVGIDHLQSLIRRFSGRWDMALSHYKADFGGSDPSDSEKNSANAAYVNKVMRLQRQYRQQAKLWAEELRSGSGPLASITAPYSREGTNATKRNKFTSGDRVGHRVEGFERQIEIRRRAAREHLDDFAPLARQSGS